MDEQRMTFVLDLEGVPVERLRQFHATPEALRALTPPGTLRRVEGDLGPLHEGQRLTLHLRKFGLPLRWRTVHEEVTAEGFTDRMLAGPFRTWCHRHRFLATPTGCRLEDEVTFSLPFRPFSDPLLPLVRRDLRNLFAFRHRATREGLAR